MMTLPLLGHMKTGFISTSLSPLKIKSHWNGDQDTLILTFSYDHATAT